MQMTMDNAHRTKDLYEASFLYAAGCKLIRLLDDHGRFWFVFEGEELCRQLTDSYWRKEATINAKEFADSIRTLKDRIFAR